MTMEMVFTEVEFNRLIPVFALPEGVKELLARRMLRPAPPLRRPAPAAKPE
jgi:hypothetical protein